MGSDRREEELRLGETPSIGGNGADSGFTNNRLYNACP
jgi:hypothetical protein